MADNTFAHAGIIVQGFSAGVLQKTTDPAADKTSKFVYDLTDIAGTVPGGEVTWSGSIMRVEVDADNVITKVVVKSSTVTILYDGSFSGKNFDGEVIQNTTTPNGNFSVDDIDLGRYTGIWELTDSSKTGPVVILITPDKTFLGSYSCVDPAPPPWTLATSTSGISNITSSPIPPGILPRPIHPRVTLMAPFYRSIASPPENRS
ncbi:MAG: hypothetical protein IIC13_12970 [SAR324 cluster bacterium]|nr:hypothetical protein [SAR324 cluster bacterium]